MSKIQIKNLLDMFISLKSISIKRIYAPELIEQQKIERRAKKFNLPVLNLVKPQQALLAKPSIIKSEPISNNPNTQFKKKADDDKVMRHAKRRHRQNPNPYKR